MHQNYFLKNTIKSALIVVSFRKKYLDESFNMNKISRRLCIFALSIIQATYIRAAFAPVEDMPLTPLHYAAMKGNLVYVKTFINSGEDVNIKATGGIYPLHCAALNNHPNIVASLVNAGAFIAIKDDEGYTPLHLAAQQGAFECLKILLAKHLEAKIAIDKRNNFKETALHCASKNGHTPCILPLLEAGAELNAFDQDNCTPLFYAVVGGHTACVETLLKNGAYCIGTFLGKKLEHWARERDYHSIAEILMLTRMNQEKQANQPKLKMD